tara:strand:+ start:1532 stop:2113 length:582 start_codon:yes stop_codon:yes gene_type:complete
MWKTLESLALSTVQQIEAPASVLEIEAGVHSFSNQCVGVHDGFVFVFSSASTDCSVHADVAVEHFVGKAVAALAMHKDHSLDLVYGRTILSTVSQRETNELLDMLSKKLSSTGQLCLGFLPSDNMSMMRGVAKASYELFPLNEHYQSVVGLNEPVRFWGQAELIEIFSNYGLEMNPIMKGEGIEGIALGKRTL